MQTGILQRNQSDLKPNAMGYTYNPYSTVSQQDLISIGQNSHRKHSMDIKQHVDIILPIIENTKRSLMQRNENDGLSNFVINNIDTLTKSNQTQKSLVSMNK